MPFSVPNTFVPFTTIYSSLMNANFTSLVNDGNTHEAAITGIHGVGSGDIVGTTLSQTLTNKTLTTPTINGGTISGTIHGTLTFDGSVSFTGTTSFTTPIVYAGGITVPTTQHVNFNVGATTFITESSANVLDITVGGNLALSIADTTSARFRNIAVAVDPGERFYYDGVGNTFADEVSSDNLRFTIGGNDAFRMQRASATKVNFGFNGNGVNPETLFAGSDAVIGNSTASASFLVIRTDVGGVSSIGFSVANNTSAASIVYNDTVNVLYINGPDVIFANANTVSFSMASGSAEFIFSGELVLPDLASPANLLCASARTLAKAWGRVDSTGTLLGGYNCSINRSGAGAGQYNVVFTFPMSNGNYAVSITPENPTFQGAPQTHIAGGFRVQMVDSTYVTADVGFDFVVYGT